MNLDIIRNKDEAVLVWSTRDGRSIPLTKMATGHICNCIRYLQKCREYAARHRLLDEVMLNKYDVTIRLFKQEMLRRGSPYREAIE